MKKVLCAHPVLRSPLFVCNHVHYSVRKGLFLPLQVLHIFLSGLYRLGQVMHFFKRQAFLSQQASLNAGVCETTHKSVTDHVLQCHTEFAMF